MKFFSSFYRVFKRTISDFSFYTSLNTHSLRSAIGYLFTLVLAILFIQTLVVAIYFATQLPDIPLIIHSFQERVNEAYPDDLVISAQDGIISINQSSPVMIDLVDLKDLEEYDHAVVFDMNGDKSDYERYHALFLVTKSEILYPQTVSDGARYEIVKVSDIDVPSKITKFTYTQFLSEFNTILQFIGNNALLVIISGVILFPIIGSFFLTLWYLFYLLFASVLLWSVAQMFRLKKGYGEVYQLGLYGISVPIVFGFMLELVGIRFPYAFMSTFLLWMVIVLSKFKSYKK
ncbi:hypothetical protein COY16_02040 [Candidatus Roizmanbacteria bacterium CG_4_10_14_0_2_um_filter_39_13]|uniref:DUF1189 domain-containing protein n=1 Tax=Candidatus Roizmanbacteria bacterium CG_4_10_14_0_2_um_filter_39_13 TaxID=1974825 RepID=A0A2M7U087_9BACT|nr:MAG: hypothetical protein COY16_02040 [Candidatus Roizmanbacteria bacterium CG_4_10_14_0_2_um_filter_39_13]